jgi:hypothetical protein
LAQPGRSPVDNPDQDDPTPISLPDPGDPNIPDVLDRRLAYAQSLAESTDGDCAARLDAVQTQRDIAASDPALDIVTGGGQARLANIDYRLHLGRAYCGAESQPHKDQLLAALDAARHAVSLYRDRYAYQPMVVMQYNVAVIQHRLGDQSQAAALETAIGMDQDFGFVSDAEENSALLRRWKGQAAASDAAPAPKRSVTLKFAWAAADADVSVQADYADLIGKTLVHSGANTNLTRHIRPDQDDWILSSEVADRHYEFAEWSGQAAPSLERTTVMLAAERMWSATLRIGATGDYKGVIDADKTAGMLGGDIELVTDDLKPASEGELDLTASLGRSVELLAQPNGLAARAAEDYTLGISAWIDATLEQGVWYDMTASLVLPGMVILVDHDIQFAYSRPVPCTGTAGEAVCAEILVHATPNPDALHSKLTYVRQALKLRGEMRYASSTDLRLVVDPARLLPYVSEARRHWTIAVDGRGDPLIGAETVVSTYTYR